MGNFLASFSFSLLPLTLVIMFSLLMPAMGTVLVIRDEIMLALALPSVANAGMALGLLCGLDSDREFVLYGFATIATLFVIVGASRINHENSRREILFAALFVGGQILSSTFSALSPVAHHHVSHLLDGEILAVGILETIVLVIICIVILSVGVINFRSVFSWCADSAYFKIGTKYYHLYLFAVYGALASVITLGVATVGTLLVTTLLVLPALFGNVNSGGIRRYIILAGLIGAVGSIIGFLVALWIDFPPAISAAAGVGITGIAMMFFYKKG